VLGLPEKLKVARPCTLTILLFYRGLLYSDFGMTFFAMC
jgi:hypothetical protein